MSDVFISYARSTEKQANAAAEALRAEGYSVWLDDQLLAHRPYTHAIEAQLAAAKAALVIWSAEAAKSEWVLSEANRAREDHKLVQLTIDGARLPMPFDQTHCAQLLDWTGDPTEPGWRKIVATVRTLVGEAPIAPAPQTDDPPGSAEPLLAVLAFDNLSGDPELAYFSDGLSEEILQTVAHGAELKVIGRSSSFQFRGGEKAAARVRSALRATHVLDGSVRRSGDRVRIAASVIECASETTLWSDRFDRQLTDIFALQDEIAAAVATALDVVFRRRNVPPKVDPAAYDAFLKAVQLGTGRVLDDAASSTIVGLLEDAVRRSPEFARAWSLLATVKVSRLRYGVAQPLDYADERAGVVEAAETALRFDPGLGGVHHSLAMLEAFGAFAAREAHYGRALQVSPRDPQVLVAHAFFLSEVGRIAEARRQAKRAFDLDPMELGAAYAYASFLDFEGRHDDTRALWDAFARQWPGSGLIATGAIAAAVQDADWTRFDALVESLAPQVATDGRTRGMVRLGRALRDPDPELRPRALHRAEQELERLGTVGLDRLTSLSAFGLLDETFALIDRASFAYMFDPRARWASGPLTGGFIFSRGGNGMMMRDVRFVGLCAKLGLVAYWLTTDRWPDCAETAAYDFRAEARRLAGGRV